MGFETAWTIIETLNSCAFLSSMEFCIFALIRKKSHFYSSSQIRNLSLACKPYNNLLENSTACYNC